MNVERTLLTLGCFHRLEHGIRKKGWAFNALKNDVVRSGATSNELKAATIAIAFLKSAHIDTTQLHWISHRRPCFMRRVLSRLSFASVV